MQPYSLNPANMFDSNGNLHPDWYRAIRERLTMASSQNLQRQCNFLADQIGAKDHVAIWAMLMWNERPPAETAELLRQWADKGMPLRPLRHRPSIRLMAVGTGRRTRTLPASPRH
jgi:hypothetical protein